MTHPKRPDLLAKAARFFPGVDFYFVGDGPEKAALANQYAHANNVFLLGEIKHFNSFRDYDIFVLCSESEGLPMSAIEASSAGLPLLLSNVGGCHELIYSNSTGDSNGSLFNNSVDELVREIKKVLTNYKSYYNYTQRIKCKFNIVHVKDEYIKLIENT